MRRASPVAPLAPILLLACAAAAPSGGTPAAPTVTVATGTTTVDPKPKPPAVPVSARQAVFDAACAAKDIPDADRDAHDELCAHADDDDEMPFLAILSTSPEIAFASLVFADRDHRAAANLPLSDPKWGRARQGYGFVLERPSPFESYAHLALAQLGTATGEADDALKHYGLSLRTRGGWGMAEVSTEAITGLGDLWPKHRKSSDFGTFLAVHAFAPWQGIGVVGGYMKAGDPTSARAVLRTILERTEHAEGCELLRPLAAKLADPADPLDAPLRRACP